MSKERFIIDKRVILDNPYGIRDYRELLNQDEVCDLLNELYEENEQLKSENERLQHFESIYRQRTLQLKKENEELKQQNDKLIRLIDDLGHEEMDRQMREILNDSN